MRYLGKAIRRLKCSTITTPASGTSQKSSATPRPGETSDFEFTPAKAGTRRIDVASQDAGWHIPLLGARRGRGED